MKYTLYLALLVMMFLLALPNMSLLQTDMTISEILWNFDIWLPKVTFFVLAVLAHIPALLKVSVQRKTFGEFPAVFHKYPEGIALGGIFVTWFTLAISGPAFLSTFLVGLLVIGAILACYIGTKTLSGVAKRLGAAAKITQDPSTAKPAKIAMSALYSLRVVTALSSLFFIISTASKASGALPLYAVAILAILGLLTVGFVVFVSLAPTQQGGVLSDEILQITEITRIQALRPEIVIYYSAPGQKSHPRLNTLVANLTKSQARFFVITRETSAYSAIKKNTPNVLLCKTIATLDACILPSLQGVLYLNDAQKNGHFIRFNHLTHYILPAKSKISHNTIPKSFAIYDRIVAPSKDLLDLWSENAEDEIKVRLLYLSKNATPPAQEQMFAIKLPVEIPSKHVVIGLHVSALPAAATPEDWGELQYRTVGLISQLHKIGNPDIRLLISYGQKVKSSKFGKATIATIEVLLEKLRLSETNPRISEWPQEGIAASLERTNFAVIAENCDACYNWSDIIICGVREPINAVRRTGKPILLFNVPSGLNADLMNEISTEDLYVLDETCSNLLEHLKQIIKNDPKAELRKNHLENMAIPQRITYTSILDLPVTVSEDIDSINTGAP